MRVVVIGGGQSGSYEERMWLYAGLSLLHEKAKVTEVIEGGVNGYAHHAKNWTLWRQACGDAIQLTTIPRRWEAHGVTAETMQHMELAQQRPDVVLACPGADGMIAVAGAHGLRVIYLEKMPVAKGKAPAAPATEASRLT